MQNYDIREFLINIKRVLTMFNLKDLFSFLDR